MTYRAPDSSGARGEGDAPGAREPEARVRIDHDRHDSLLQAEIWLAQPRDVVFAFFSDAYNLERITPPFLRFSIRDVSTATVTRGSRIRYRLRLHGIPVYWTTLISHWDPPFHFRDTQIRGPYRVWEHDHDFIEVDGGTLMRDRVRYRPRVSWLRHTPLLRWIDADVKRIFQYRHRVIGELFGRGYREDTGRVL